MPDVTQMQDFKERRGAKMKEALNRMEQAFKEVEVLLPSATMTYGISIAVTHNTGVNDWLEVSPEKLVELYLNPPDIEGGA